MKTSTRNQAIAVLMVSILVLLAFWWWSSRTPSKSFAVDHIVWDPSTTTLQLGLSLPIDRSLYKGKTAILKQFTSDTANPVEKQLIESVMNYPFVIAEDGGIVDNGYTINIGSLPKGVPDLPAVIVTPTGASSLRINLK